MVVQSWEREALLRKQIGRLSEELRGIFGVEAIARYVHESLESLEGRGSGISSRSSSTVSLASGHGRWPNRKERS